MRSCSDGVYRRAELTGRPCLLGDIGKCAAPCVGRISTEEHRAIAERLRLVHGRQRHARTSAASPSEMKAAASAQDYEAAARHRDAIQALESGDGQERRRAARRRGRRRLRHRPRRAGRRGAAVHRARRPHPRCAQLGGRQGARRRARRARRDRACRTRTKARTRRRARSSCPSCPKTPPSWSTGSPRAARRSATRRRAAAQRSGRLRVAQRGDKAALAQTVEMNAKNALVLYKTRRSSRLRRALAGAQRHPGCPRAWTTRRCGWSATTSRTSAARTSSPRWSCSRTACRAKTSTAGSASRSPPTTPSRSTRCISAGWRTSKTRRRDPDATADETAEPTARRRGDDAEIDVDAEVADGRREAPPQVLLPAEPAHRRRRPAAGRGRRARARRVGRARASSSPASPSGSRRSGCPTPTSRSSCRATATRSSCIQRIRDEAHRFAITYQRARRKRDIGSVLGEIPGLGPARVKELLKHFGSVAQLKKATPEQIAEVRGHRARRSPAAIARAPRAVARLGRHDRAGGGRDGR